MADGAAIDVEYPGGAHAATFYGETRVVLPAGEQKVTVRIGSGEVSETIALAAGATVEKDVVVGVGRVVVNARYAAGGDKVEASGVSFNVVAAAKQADGSRRHVASAFGPDSERDCRRSRA